MNISDAIGKSPYQFDFIEVALRELFLNHGYSISAINRSSDCIEVVGHKQHFDTIRFDMKVTFHAPKHTYAESQRAIHNGILSLASIFGRSIRIPEFIDSDFTHSGQTVIIHFLNGHHV